jgi:tetratricopeptide (TPR) repeat protein
MLVPALVLAMASAVGCDSSTYKNKTQHEKAKLQWNAARASVMATLAQDQYKNGDFDKCRTTINDALKLNPENPQLHILSAKLAIEQGQLEVAERELQQTQRIDPNNAEGYYLSGVVYQRWQQPQRAFECYSLACEKNPNELAYLMAKAEMMVAMDKPHDALLLLQEKVVFFEHSGAIRDAVGQLLVREKRFPEAVDMLKQASILAEDDNSIREHLALGLFFNKQFRESADVLTKLTGNEKYAKRGDLFLTLGECHLQSNRPREARAAFETATQLMPGSASAWLSLGKAALELNDLKRAELCLKKSTAIEPRSSEASLLTGYLRLKQNRLDDALLAFRTASALDREDPVAVCMAGYVLEKQGKPEQAMKYYAKALKLKPGDELATRLMASIDARE